jgi:hypothetical protein
LKKTLVICGDILDCFEARNRNTQVGVTIKLSVSSRRAHGKQKVARVARNQPPAVFAKRKYRLQELKRLSLPVFEKQCANNYLN